MACDQSNAFSIMVTQANLDKIVPMTETSIMGVAGPLCDASSFSQYISKNLHLYQFMGNAHVDAGQAGAGVPTVHAQAHFTRNELAQALRRAPYQVNLLYGGVDLVPSEETEGDDKTNKRIAKASLYSMDYLASLHKVPFGAQGYAAYFCLSVLDRAYPQSPSETTLEQALTMIQQCIAELQTRFLISQPNFLIKVVDADGVRTISHGADPQDN